MKLSSIDVLGFNPVSKEIQVLIANITPEIAKYILEYHNFDNRKIIRSQVNKIRESIREDGWLEDGQPLTFNTQGNITEFQHRLEAILAEGITVKVVVVLGVEPNCFTQCAPAKPRKAEDEIQRKDKTATPRQVSTLRQFLNRRQGEKLTINNAIRLWDQWKHVVREGRELVDGFFDSVDQFDTWERTFAAWASLMVYVGRGDVATTFLELLQDEILDSGSTCLSRGFIDFYEAHNNYLSNSGRTDLIYQMLCIAGDRVEKVPTGRVQFGMDIGQMNHDFLKQKGFYRQFLDKINN